jgi:tetratricopeptide (TPR) repeat protein
MARQGKEAAAEFQKLLDYRSIVLNSPLGALAHLGLGRAYVLQGDTAKARGAYQDFLALWKEADPDKCDLHVSAQPIDKLQNRARFRLDETFHPDLSCAIHHRNRNAFLVHIHTDILFAIH